MKFQLCCVLLPFLAASIAALPSSPIPPPPKPTPPYPSPVPPRAGYYPSNASQRPVFTAQRIREHQSIEEDEPAYPSTSTLGTAQTLDGVEDPQNTGFVEPIDFARLLKEVEASSKSLDFGASSSNPLFTSESKNSYQGFFDADNSRDPFADFRTGRLNTASSEKSTSKAQEDPTGFVDPNVQFRSLFDSAQTNVQGFRPEDFLGTESSNVPNENSRGSSTRAYPSYTYTGRREDGEPNRFRSSFRQVDDDYYRDDEDRDYYGSPVSRGPSQSSRYNHNERAKPRESPSTEAAPTSNRPQSTGRGSKASDSNKNSKCKKIEKQVDYENDDFESYSEPESDYDPSTYRGRYKRQSRQPRQNRQSGRKKRPMTCYVCQDEEGRYAERCSYDSKGNPKNGEYFHSSSSSFSDNGNGNGRRGKSDRHRRNSSPRRSKLHAAPTTFTGTAVLPPTTIVKDNITLDIEDSEPKTVEKRQSGPGRYAGRFGGNSGAPAGGPGPGGRGNRNEFEYQAPNAGDYGLPRGYLGHGEGRGVGFDGPQFQPNDGPSEGGRRRQSGDGGGERGQDDYDFGFGGGGFNNNDFDFGPPADFDRESNSENSGPGSRDSGFNYDFSIPREYDPDIQLGRRNNNNRNLDGEASTESFPNNFDISYDDYVRRHFPETFGPASSSEASSSTRGPSPSFQPSGPPVSHGPPPGGPSYVPRPRFPEASSNSFNQFDRRGPPPPPPRRHHAPEKEHNTQPSFNFSPPPNFFSNGPSSSGGFRGPDIEHSDNLNQLVQNFDKGKDRSGCQRVQKGDMSCYVCRDPKGMNKEECVFASNDPNNQRMAYHEVTEYSSDPPASILPAPNNDAKSAGSSAAASSISTRTASPNGSKVSSKESNDAKTKSSSPRAKTVTKVQSMVFSKRIHHESKSPDYDFDY